MYVSSSDSKQLLIQLTVTHSLIPTSRYEVNLAYQSASLQFVLLHNVHVSIALNQCEKPLTAFVICVVIQLHFLYNLPRLSGFLYVVLCRRVISEHESGCRYRQCYSSDYISDCVCLVKLQIANLSEQQ